MKFIELQGTNSKILINTDKIECIFSGTVINTSIIYMNGSDSPIIVQEKYSDLVKMLAAKPLMEGK